MNGKIVVVTGAAGALGSVVASHFAARGARVVGIDLARFGGDIRCELALGGIDLTSEPAIAGAFARIGEAFAQIDGLVNIAGGFHWETIAEGSAATWDRMYAMNVKSCLLASHAALASLRRPGGAIVNISAAASQRADAGMGAYAAAKAGVSRLTESLAAELKDAGIRVNAVLPSIIDTPANRAGMPQADFSRWVGADALADVIAFLLSDDARAVTGALLPVTGRV